VCVFVCLCVCVCMCVCVWGGGGGGGGGAPSACLAAEELHPLCAQASRAPELGPPPQIVSNFKPVDTSHLSAAFNGLPTTFGFTLMKKPVDVILRFQVRLPTPRAREMLRAPCPEAAQLAASASAGEPTGAPRPSPY